MVTFLIKNILSFQIINFSDNHIFHSHDILWCLYNTKSKQCSIISSGCSYSFFFILHCLCVFLCFVWLKKTKVLLFLPNCWTQSNLLAVFVVNNPSPCSSRLSWSSSTVIRCLGFPLLSRVLVSLASPSIWSATWDLFLLSSKNLTKSELQSSPSIWSATCALCLLRCSSLSKGGTQSHSSSSLWSCLLKGQCHKNLHNILSYEVVFWALTRYSGPGYFGP